MAAMAETMPLSRWRQDVLVLGIVGALLLHAAAGWLLVFGWPSLALPPPAPMLVAVEFVSPPAPPAPPPEPAPAAATPLPMVRPPPPVLEEAPIAETSRPTPAPGPESIRPGPAERPQGPAREPPAPRAPPPPPPVVIRGGGVAEPPAVRRITPPSLVDNAPFQIGRADRAAGVGGATEARQRTEGDFILAQVIPFWLIDRRNRNFRGVELWGPFMLQADGMLSYPYGKNDPWQPEAMIGNWLELQQPGKENTRVALESFLRAVRSAQPFKLPPGVTGGYPRRIMIHFSLGDL